jgi:SAM-dependent methyltransferase
VCNTLNTFYCRNAGMLRCLLSKWLTRVLCCTMFCKHVCSNRSVLDLGCGTGMLGIAAAIMGAGHVLGVDVDASALAVAASNIESCEVDHIDLLCCDARACAVRGLHNADLSEVNFCVPLACRLHAAKPASNHQRCHKQHTRLHSDHVHTCTHATIYNSLHNAAGASERTDSPSSSRA